MPAHQTCPRCKYVNVVFGLYASGSGNSEGQRQAPQVKCGRCGMRFEAKEREHAAPARR